MQIRRTREVMAILGLAVALCGLVFSGASAVKRMTAHMRASGHSITAPASAPVIPEVADGLAAIDRALRAGDVRAALTAWHPAYTAALRDRRWNGLIDVADAWLRIERAAGAGKAGDSKARELYLMALFRARHEGSVAGVLRAAIAFDQLGDRDVAARALGIAATLDENIHVAEAVNVSTF